MKQHKLIFVLPAVLLLATLAHAQPNTLTLEQAVALAIERAPQMQAKAAALESAQSQAVSAGRLPDPELVVGVENLPATGADAGSFDRDFMTMRKMGVMQAFPNGAKRSSQRQRAAAVVTLAQSQSQQTSLETARAAATAWIESYAAELVFTKLQALRPDVELQAQAARAALASGRGSTVDALAAQDAISELEGRLLDAKRETQAARAELARWIGEEAGQPLAEAPLLRELPAPREKLLARLNRHGPLLTFDAQRAVAQSEIDLARAEKRPDWSTELSYAKRGDAFSDMVSLQFRVGLPLFSRNRQDPMIRAKRAELSQLEAERDTALRMQAAEVTRQLAAWDAARQRIELYERERLPLARQRSQAALAGFQAGRVEFLSVLASQVREIEVQRDYAELLKALGQAWAFLNYLEPGQESSHE
jgi:outer membrane protein TolC